MAVTLSPSGLQYVQGTDVESAFPAIDQANKTILNAAMFWQSGTLASIPTATSVPPGTHYYATDVARVYLTQGSAWLLISASALTYTSVTLASGVSAFSGDYTPSARVEGDRVWLRGTVENTSGGNITANTTIFTLPSGMAPSVSTALVPAMNTASSSSTTATYLQVASTRAVSLTINIATGSTVALNGLNFSLI